MSDIKRLNNDQLKNVIGGVTIGNERIVQCDGCLAYFNPDNATKGSGILNTDGQTGGELLNTYICPNCHEEHTFKVIQILEADLTIDKLRYS